MSEAAAPRLLVDAMLGRLARWLRILGCDVLYDPAWTDNELVRRARAEGRILLTRDTALARRRGVRTLFVESEVPEIQLRQVVRDLDLRLEAAFSHCPVCNDRLEAVPKSSAWGYVPPYTFCTQDEFRLCPNCNRFYWRGTHWQHMQESLSELDRETQYDEEKEGELETLEMARRIADVLADRLAEDITVLDLQGTTIIADYFVICTGTSDRQLRAFVEALSEELGKEGISPRRVEGSPESGWVLVDFGGVIVHLFSPDRRSFYRLEQLWSGARVVVRIA